MNSPDGLQIEQRSIWVDPAVYSLVVANLIPLFGLLFLDWTAGLILLLYWCETFIIGFYTILKLPFCVRWFALFAVPFFTFHFGGFIWFAGFVSLGLYALLEQEKADPYELLNPVKYEFITFCVCSLISHGISFYSNFIKPKAYLLKHNQDTDQLMIAPYGRTLVIIGTFMIGMVLFFISGTPMAMVVLFIVFKIIEEILFYHREKKKLTTVPEELPDVENTKE